MAAVALFLTRWPARITHARRDVTNLRGDNSRPEFQNIYVVL